MRKKIKLEDIYDAGELFDEEEVISNIVDSSHLEKLFTINTLTPEKAIQILTMLRDTTVYEAYMDFAEPWQKRLVSRKVRFWDNDRVIVLDGNRLVDGNHHLVAGILSKKNIKFIDLSEDQ